MLDYGADIAKLLRRMVEIGHAVDDGHGAGLGKADDGVVRDDARHNDVHKAREHAAGVLNGLVAAQLNHAGAEILGMPAHLAHCGFKRHARTRR